MSGNAENAGQILKLNHGLENVFGYNKNEVIGHLVNILMPLIYAKKHKNFLESFFKIGHKAVFNSSKTLYAMHRNGFCFGIKLIVKQLPNFAEGIQYVGMIKKCNKDYDVILTDVYDIL